MTATCPQYRVRYRMYGSDYEHTSQNGPYDYRSNAIAERDARFQLPNVTHCWIEKEYQPTGRVLVRK